MIAGQKKREDVGARKAIFTQIFLLHVNIILLYLKVKGKLK